MLDESGNHDGFLDRMELLTALQNLIARDGGDSENVDEKITESDRFPSGER
jgi:hypothetical protein